VGWANILKKNKKGVGSICSDGIRIFLRMFILIVLGI